MQACYALLSSGASFSCEVLQALIERDRPPSLLVLPEYAPSRATPNDDKLLFKSGPRRRLLQLARGVEIAYAPAGHQHDCARLLRQRAIDFLLVACWPYLIGETLIDGVTRAALNMHPSLLPKYRGPNPLQRQLAAGDDGFGVTLHLLNRHFDRGDIVARQTLAIDSSQPEILDIERRCACEGAGLFIDALERHPNWELVPQPVQALEID